MVTGVNTNSYNYYNNYQNQFGNYAQPSVSFSEQSVKSQKTAPSKTSADGRDDGYISLLSKMKNLGIGALKFVTGMFTDENGVPSLTQTLKTAAIAAGIGAVCVLTAGTAVPALLATAGVAVSSLGIAKAGVQAALADSDAEAEQAWQSLGSNGVALGLSVAGAKAVAKSTHATEAANNKFSGLKGLWNSVKTVAKDSYKPIGNAFEGVKDAYQGASLLDKVKNSGTKFSENVTAQYKDFKGNVGTNYKNVVYGSATKVENEAAALDKQRADLEKKMSSVSDKTSKHYKSLEAKLKEVEVRQEAMREINTATSWQDANSKIEANKALLESKKANFKAVMTDAQKAKIKAEISELETRINTQESVLSRRTSEVRAIDKRIETITGKMNKEGISAEQQAKYQADLNYLNQQRTAANFELPNKPVKEVKLSDLAADKINEVNARKRVYLAERKINNNEIINNPKDYAAAYDEYLQAKAELGMVKKQSAKNVQNYNTQQTVTPGGVKSQAVNELYRASKTELTKGNWKDNLLHQNNPSQWLTAGIAGRQFGETQEYRFYSQLSPQEQQAYKNMSANQKQSIINTYNQIT